MLNEISKMTSIKKQSRIEYYKIILQTAVEAGTASSYNQDTEWEGRVADCIIPIKQGKLEIKTWWMKFKEEKNYHLLVNNCCTVIIEALTKGGATKYEPIFYNFGFTPPTLKLYALKLKKSTQ
jgi:hypothetical protein